MVVISLSQVTDLFPVTSGIDNRSELVASFHAILHTGFKVNHISKENCSR